MVTLENILSEPLIYRLGWVLVHFIWQGVVAAILLAVALQILRRRSANVRYVAACISLLLMAVLPALTLTKTSAPTPNRTLDIPAAASEPQVIPGFTGSALNPVVAPSEFQAVLTPSSRWEVLIHARRNISVLIEPYLPFAVLIWLMGVFTLSVYRAGGWVELQRFKKKQVKPIAKVWAERFKILAQEIRVNRPVRIVESAIVQIPSTIGWLKPVVLVPTSALTGLPPKQLEAIIAHELAHIRRHDYLVNLIQTCMETLFFYHPAVWWVSHRIRIEREQCCDDIAVAVCGDAVSYARALTKLEEFRHTSAQLAMAASGGHLLNRIRYLLNISSPYSNRSNVWAASSVGIA